MFWGCLEGTECGEGGRDEGKDESLAGRKEDG